MTARADLTRAAAASAQLDLVNQAIAALGSNYSVAGVYLRNASGAQIVVDLALPTNAVLTLLNNRAAQLQNLLTSLGVT